MNGLGSPPPSNNRQLPVEGVVTSGGASAHAHHLVKMRVNPKSPLSPLTPIGATTPAFMHMNITRFGEENIMEDLQLAAELGKTLLERNRELESNIKHQHAIIEDQIQEIEYLSKQTAALREVNDSRLRIYEQLEISIQELEKNNQRLSAEGASDKRKIKSLCGNIESLESRGDELQKNLEEARAGAQQARGRNNNKRRSIILDEHNYRRSHSCENTTQSSEEKAAEELETRTRMEELQERLKDSQNERVGEVRRREELEIQLACMAQENAVLQDQLLILREKEVTLRSFDEELASLDDASSGRLCRKCLGHVDDTASNPGLYDLHDSIEDTDASIESIHGECALVKLKNGGYAWGSQESLASIGQVVSCMGSGGTSPGTEASDAPHNSLLSELDTSYRILIEKYEALLEAREHQQQQVTQNTDLSRGLVHPGVDDLSGPMSLVMTDGMHEPTIGLKCQRCHTCTCDLKPSVGRPKSNMEEFSEVETSSSGFSDGESRLSNKATQTGDELIPREIYEDFTPTPTVANRCLDLSSPLNPCDKRFQAAPEYKKLFQEIFSVLKKTVDEKDGQPQSAKSCKTPYSVEAPPNQVFSHINTASPAVTETICEKSELIEKILEIKIPPTNIESEAEIPPTNIESEASTVKAQELSNHNCNPSLAVSHTANASTELVLAAENLLSTKHHLATEKSINNTVSSECLENSEDQHITHKPPRPDSLDLGSSSRSSSRQRRRRRHHRGVRLDALQQQQQYQGQYQYTHGILNTSHTHGQSSHRHHRRDRESQPHIQRQQPDDFPNLQAQTEGECNRTRIVYNSSRGRCEHHRSRKPRDRSNSSHHQRHQQQNSQDINEQQQNTQIDHLKLHLSELESRDKTTTKINFPSVEVAKLRKLEMTYAEALKTSFSRSYYNRRY